MKISLITITYKDGALLDRCLESIYSQQLPPECRLDHIVINGDSGPLSAPLLKATAHGATVAYRPPEGVYPAINAGIELATGDIIGIVHGSDMLADPDALRRVAAAFTASGADFVYGDTEYISLRHPGKVYRYYSASKFTSALLLKGIAPPHPSFFIRRQAMREMGSYREDFRIAGDFEFFVRLFLGKHKFTGEYLPGVTVAMEKGGISSRPYNVLVSNTLEKRRALRLNGYDCPLPRLLARYFIHLKTTLKP